MKNGSHLGKMYQNIIFELADGRLINTTVPAFCFVGDKVKVKEIRVTHPKKLPKDCTFEDMEYLDG